ncbi:MAG: MATE family efflux transporter [Lachnospiraceae bacterium]|nr:MATE family efflux transporter [Lachnospiraceae bacterium]
MNKTLRQAQSLKQNTDFLKNTFRKAVFPCMLSTLSANINVFVDGMLVGNRIGIDALAAINLSLPLYLLFCVGGSFFASGTAINAARAIGKNDSAKSQEYYCTCITGLFTLSILIMVIGLLFRNPLVAFLCSDKNIQPFVMQYVVITLIGTLPKIMIYAPFWYLRLDGKNMEVTAMMAVMSVGNVLLDVLFVYVWDMGVFGAGLASVIATTVACVMGMVCLLRKDGTFHFRPFCYKKITEWKEIVEAGMPAALNNLLSAIRILFINSILMNYGGGAMVAVFTAVTGIAGFGECITLGIPQAASAMLGVYSGEKDNGSCSLLVKLQWMTGCVYTCIFLIACMAAAGVIQDIYRLEDSLLAPLVWMAVSVFPALFCNIVSGYYNMAKKTIWANGIIFSRVIVMTYIGIRLAVYWNWPVYSFLLFAELATITVWFAATGINHRLHTEETRFLLMNTVLEQRGRILNFSVGAVTEEICNASERIMTFCETNGMNQKKTMRLQLAIEEIMTLICQVNEEKGDRNLTFDLRAYSLDGITGIRIRYNGVQFNPFDGTTNEDDRYMGIHMIRKMIEKSVYLRTFGVNTLQVILREE